MICRICDKETYEHPTGLCMECYKRFNTFDVDDPVRQLSLEMTKKILAAPPISRHPKVQFFDDHNLVTMRDQMNKFFEDLEKDDIVDIKFNYSKGRYTVMIVYV